MLLVVGAQTAVVGASPFHGRVVNERHFRGLDENLPAAAVVVDVVGDEDALSAVLRTALQEVDISVLEDGLAFHLAVAGGADRDGNGVEKMGAGFSGHGRPLGRDGSRLEVRLKMSRAAEGVSGRSGRFTPGIGAPVTSRPERCEGG